jgi:hypothetical protein
MGERVPLESVPVGAKVRVYRISGDIGWDGREFRIEDHGGGFTLMTDGNVFTSVFWLAEVIAPPDCAPQHPMAEEVPWPSSASFVHTCTDGIARVVCDQCTPDSRDAEISRLRADLAYHDRQAALRDAATGKVAGHAEQCACHGCVTGPLEREVERLTSERDEYKAKAEALAEILAAAMVEEDAAGCGA